jgi:hypothetical protein
MQNIKAIRDWYQMKKSHYGSHVSDHMSWIYNDMLNTIVTFFDQSDCSVHRMQSSLIQVFIVSQFIWCCIWQSHVTRTGVSSYLPVPSLYIFPTKLLCVNFKIIIYNHFLSYIWPQIQLPSKYMISGLHRTCLSLIYFEERKSIVYIGGVNVRHNWKPFCAAWR